MKRLGWAATSILIRFRRPHEAEALFVSSVIAALIAPTTMFANTTDGTPYDYSGFDRGKGIAVYVDVKLNQDSIKEEALAAVLVVARRRA